MPSPIHLNTIRVLVADDDEFVAKGMQATLKTSSLANLEVEIEYELIEKVYHKLRSNRFEVLILDLDWYGNRTTSLKTIRELKETNPDLRIVAISAYPELVNQASEVGAEIARPKGFTGRELIKLVKDVLEMPVNRFKEDRKMGDEKKLEQATKIVYGNYYEGNISTGGGNVVGRDQVGSTAISSKEIAKLFKILYTKIDAHPNTSPKDKEYLKIELQEVQTEIDKGEEANESFLARRLRNIERMAPDILEVVVATLTNPAAGFNSVVTKVANKMKESSDNSS